MSKQIKVSNTYLNAVLDNVRGRINSKIDQLQKELDSIESSLTNQEFNGTVKADCVFTVYRSYNTKSYSIGCSIVEKESLKLQAPKSFVKRFEELVRQLDEKNNTIKMVRLLRDSTCIKDLVEQHIRNNNTLLLPIDEAALGYMESSGITKKMESYGS